MLNAVAMIDEQLKSRGKQAALYFPGSDPLSFAQLAELSARVQTALLRSGLKTGQSILLAIELSPLLYASIIACARLGITIILVEPWMPLARIEEVLSVQPPTAFLAGTLGRLWGFRVAGIRKIPLWLHARQLLKSPANNQECLMLSGEQPCLITFTSGSTGVPKGVVRSHAYLQDQHRVIHGALDTAQLRGPDLVIFANMALENLAAGRCSLIIPSRWPLSALAQINQLPSELQPQSLVGGPAFLRLALKYLRLPQLQALFVGGALADCADFEAALSRWPAARSMHVYGSTEAEPVAFGPLREAVQRSRSAGYFQVLFAGQACVDTRYRQDGQQIWITGPHVCPEYLANPEANRLNKKRDTDGTLWHRMGDRIRIESEGWWYAGREQESVSDFYDEQRLFSAIQSSEAMLARDSQGQRLVYAAEAKRHKLCIESLWSEPVTIFQTEIKRDRRHRARIDRDATRKAKVCAIG